MTLASMRYVVARLLTEPAYRERFFSAQPGPPADHGLAPEEFAVLARLDPRKLGITSEGFAGKRFERVASGFPRTLAALDGLDRGWRARYLATTRFASDETAERATFLGFLRAGGHRTGDAQRFVEDLAACEALLFDAPRPAGPPRYRWRPETTRPRRTALAGLRLRVRGPLAAALADPAARPARYPPSPAEVLVTRDGGRVAAVDLASFAGALLAACDGSATAARLVEAHGPGAEHLLKEWLRLGVVEDAAREP